MYLLARRVSPDRFAAAMAGLAFETGPYLTHQLGGHLDLVGAYPIPVALAVLRPRSNTV